MRNFGNTFRPGRDGGGICVGYFFYQHIVPTAQRRKTRRLQIGVSEVRFRIVKITLARGKIIFRRIKTILAKIKSSSRG
jgi:hypothetical protein